VPLLNVEGKVASEIERLPQVRISPSLVSSSAIEKLRKYFRGTYLAPERGGIDGNFNRIACEYLAEEYLGSLLGRYSPRFCCIWWGFR
jgi:hypothetical protein